MQQANIDDRPQVFDLTQCSQIIEHFAVNGWVMVDALAAATVADLDGWVGEVAAWPARHGEWLHHFEMTETGPQLARTENFVPFHPSLRSLLCGGALADVATMLLGESAVLYKEKINFKLPGGAGFSPHQDAPAYPLIHRHVSAMIAVDDADVTNGCLEVVSGCHDRIWPSDERGCVHPEVVGQMHWMSVPVPAGMTLWFHSLTPHRSGPNCSPRPRRAIYPTYNAASEGDRRADYYAEKLRAFAAEDAKGTDRRTARVSLIDDFDGRPV